MASETDRSSLANIARHRRAARTTGTEQKQSSESRDGERKTKDWTRGQSVRLYQSLRGKRVEGGRGSEEGGSQRRIVETAVAKRPSTNPFETHRRRCNSAFHEMIRPRPTSGYLLKANEMRGCDRGRRGKNRRISHSTAGEPLGEFPVPLVRAFPFPSRVTSARYLETPGTFWPHRPRRYLKRLLSCPRRSLTVANLCRRRAISNVLIARRKVLEETGAGASMTRETRRV